jgi:DNA-directed RNA polymerase subunit M/transcription elongation factor TFIIS
LVAESESGYEIKKDVEGQTLEVDIQNYEAEIEAVDEKLQEILPSNRVIGLYDVLPSLRSNRINFAIEKDIFRNKPLLGKGQFRCKFCDSVNTEDYEIQTRRADEGAIVKVICRDCTKQYIL